MGGGVVGRSRLVGSRLGKTYIASYNSQVTSLELDCLEILIKSRELFLVGGIHSVSKVLTWNTL